MYELSITKIKYPQNDTVEYEYNTIDSMLMELKLMLEENKIKKNDIIRINILGSKGE